MLRAAMNSVERPPRPAAYLAAVIVVLTSCSGATPSASVPVGTGSTNPYPVVCDAADGSATDVASEPNWRMYGDYRAWTTADGCQLRIDVIGDRPGPAHCGFQEARVIITGMPVGTRYTNAEDAADYVRDPNNVFGDIATSLGFDADADLPTNAVDTGFRLGQTVLWVVPGDASSIFLASGANVERWPLDPDPAGCA